MGDDGYGNHDTYDSGDSVNGNKMMVVTMVLGGILALLRGVKMCKNSI